ncbi:MAG: hypothetical protein JW959_02725 [Pirellulales bacterium]|nr:hypothetical protein [Pirellulales bacterium]
MPIKLNCPRCKTPLQVPSKLAGSYVNCPHCKGRLWVSKEAAVERPPAASVAEPPSEKGASPAGPSPADPPRPPPPRKKVARFIAADDADSKLLPAQDGKLPGLRLDEEAIKDKRPQEKKTSMNPLVLLGLLSASVVLSIVLALVDLNPPTGSGSETKDQQRYLIERDYFGSGNIDNRDLEPHQLLLREAQRAHIRGDRETERDNYRRVLKMLRAERAPGERGLTGSRRRDKQLEDAITVLLSGD